MKKKIILFYTTILLYGLTGSMLLSACVTASKYDELLKRKLDMESELKECAREHEELRQQIFNKQQTYSVIENTSLKLMDDQLIINYDINGTVSFDNVWVEITTLSGTKINAQALSGDVGPNIKAGKSKQIIWDMKKDNIDLQGQEINVTVNGK